MKALRSRHPQSLPLGVDLGTERVRIALVHRHPDGSTELVAVAARECGDDPTAALAGALAEIRTSERRCVFGIGEPRALLQNVRFPKMRRAEYERAARFEAAHLVDYPIHEAIVRVVTLGSDGDAVIGVVRKDVIASIVAIAQAAKLRVSAVDNTAFALRRAIPHIDAILDIGEIDSRLHVFAGNVPLSRRFPIGGATFTRAIAQALGSDTSTAQRRKHAHGIAGCGEATRDLLVADIANALVACRADGLRDVRTIALVGNGSRLADLAAAIERATAVHVRAGTLDSAVSRTLPPDVLRAATPDWCLAYGLALWSAS